MRRAKTLTLIAAALLTAHVVQADPLSYTSGDLLMGFRSTASGETDVYLLNLGQADLYNGGSYNPSLGNVGSDLSAPLGSDWYTAGNLYWGVIGQSDQTAPGADPSNTLYAGKSRLDSSPVNTGYERKSNSTQGTTNTKINTLRDSSLAPINSNLYDTAATDPDFLGTGLGTGQSAFAIKQNTSDTNDWSDFMQGGTQATGGLAFGAFQPTQFEGVVGEDAALDLFRMERTTTTGLPGDYRGTFSIGSNGDIAFVPEPSTYALLAAGGIALAIIMRRRRAASVA